MSISNKQAEKLIEQYREYPEKIVKRFYYFVSPAVKEELCHVGLIGLWKGILAYYKRSPDTFERKAFVHTVCAYMRYEMAGLFHELKLMRISDNQWRNFFKIQKFLTQNPDISEDRMRANIEKSGLRYDWYLKTKQMISPVSLDMTINEDRDEDQYEILAYNDLETMRLENQSYINYIIDSAMYGIRLDRDKELIRTWLKSVYDKNKLDYVELGRKYQLSPCMVSVIINRFIDICRFVRDCECEFYKNSEGVIYFPEIAEKNKTYNRKKIPGVKWVYPNRKWKVEISVGKRKSVYIGHFEKYKDAVRARRDAEIKYRGFSEIKM